MTEDKSIAGALLTADEVMAAAEPYCAPVVWAVLKDAFDGNGKRPAKGEINSLLLRELALEPVTMFRRKIAGDQTPAHIRKKAREAS